MSISKFYETTVTTIANNTQAKLTIKSKLNGAKVVVPAFLTSFTQTFTSNWNEEEVYGRMDPIATFQGTRRSISLGFDLPAANLDVAKDNLKECDKLAQFLYPGYVDQKGKNAQGEVVSNGKTISRPPLVAVKFANLISAGGAAQLGYLSGLEWTPVLEMGMFTSSNSLYPKVISLSFTLNVLHQATKGLGSGNTWISGSATFFGK